MRTKTLKFRERTFDNYLVDRSGNIFNKTTGYKLKVSKNGIVYLSEKGKANPYRIKVIINSTFRTYGKEFRTVKYNGKTFKGYIVNRDGEVFNKYTGRKVKLSLGRHYLRVNLSEYGTAITAYVHRIVASTFKPLDDYTGMTVDHVDMNKLNNNIDNLEWVTQSENVKRAIEITGDWFGRQYNGGEK